MSGLKYNMVEIKKSGIFSLLKNYIFHINKSVNKLSESIIHSFFINHFFRNK